MTTVCQAQNVTWSVTVTTPCQAQYSVYISWDMVSYYDKALSGLVIYAFHVTWSVSMTMLYYILYRENTEKKNIIYDQTWSVTMTVLCQD